MQAIMETIFDIIYLTSVITIGILIGKNHTKNKKFFLISIMAITLGIGDAFHLVPRVIALWTTGLDDYVLSLGFGKLVTSITMTIFYVLLYHIWKLHYNVTENKNITNTVYALALLRILLCLFPQNKWLSVDSPISWGIYRNIPFLILGLIIIYLFYKSDKENNDLTYKYIWLAITLSFAFYIPVVLFADIYPLVGILMLPKTCCYLWIIVVMYKDFKTSTLTL